MRACTPRSQYFGSWHASNYADMLLTEEVKVSLHNVMRDCSATAKRKVRRCNPGSKCYLVSNLNRARFWLHAGNHI